MDQENEYPIFKTPKGKTVEVKPVPQSSLWMINPHGVNIPNYLKGTRYTTAEYGSTAVLKWLKTLEK